MIIGITIGLMVVVALALFVGGIAVGAWLQTDYENRRRVP